MLCVVDVARQGSGQAETPVKTGRRNRSVRVWEFVCLPLASTYRLTRHQPRMVRQVFGGKYPGAESLCSAPLSMLFST